jgi:ketosteroid isomerase-like protein
VRRAAAVLIAAFGSNDVDRYLACFREDATFLFHTTDRLLASREEYRQEWASWVRDDDFRCWAARPPGRTCRCSGTSPS